MSNASGTTYRVVEYVTHVKAPPPGPHHKQVVAENIQTLADARAEAERRSKLHPHDGYNEEQDYWWGRGASPADIRLYYTAEVSE